MILTESNFDDQTKTGVALVDFWAPWCGPCNMMMPTIEELATDYSGKALIGKVNIDEEAALAAKHKISAIPALLFFKDGELQETFMGIQSKDAITKKLDELLSE